jgi:hypothetical protein
VRSRRWQIKMPDVMLRMAHMQWSLTLLVVAETP